MSEAWFGFLGVIVGACIPWAQTVWFHQQEKQNNARYLAIRVVCILDKYLEDCVAVVQDNGVPGEQDCMEAEVTSPDAPIFPTDVDWKSISHELMYSILSFPSEVEAGKSAISWAADQASPPDYDEFFEERALWYAKYGLMAYAIAGKLREEYDIPQQEFKDWNPVTYLQERLQRIEKARSPVLVEAA